MIKKSNLVGREVFNNFDGLLKREKNLFTEENKAEMLKNASTMALQMPYVSLPFREVGIVDKNESIAKILHVFRPNLWAQDYANEINMLDKMTVETAYLRAHAAADYTLENSVSLRYLLKKKGLSDFDFVNAIRGAALIEAAYYSLIGGDKMNDVDGRRIKAALMWRTLDTNTVFASVAKSQGVSKDDPLGLWQFSEVFELAEYQQEIYKKDPYFMRRFPQFETFNKMNAEKSIKLQSFKDRDVVNNLVTRLMKKHKVDPWLVKAVDNAFKETNVI